MKGIKLNYGDVIDIIAPSHKPEQNYSNKIINGVKNIISQMGFNARIDRDIFNYDEDIFCANNTKYRKEKFIDALINSDSKAIWCIQGGYGANNFIADLDKLTPPKKQKIFIGFSDITVMHIFLNCRWDWPSIHYRNLSQLCNYSDENVTQEEIFTIKNFLLGNLKDLSYEVSLLNDIKFEGEGRVIGGNLCLINHSLATNWEINTDNKFLFIEEVGERGYSIDRMLYHLEQAGKLKRVKAILIGEILCAPEKNGEERCDLAIKNLCARVKVPIFKMKGFGHGKKNSILPFNFNCKIVNNRLEYVFK